MRPAKILIRLCEYAALSESSLGAHVRSYVSDVAAQYAASMTKQRLLVSIYRVKLPSKI